MNKNLKWFALAIIGYIAFSKFLLSKSISIFYKGLDFSNLSFSQPILNLKVQVNNPTNTTADLQSIRGILYIDGVQVGSVFGITPITIISGTSLITIPVTLSYLGITDLIRKFSYNQFSLEFKGEMIVDFIPIPLNFNYNI